MQFLESLERYDCAERKRNEPSSCVPFASHTPPPPQHIFAEWQLHYILRNTWVDLIKTKGKAQLYLYFSGTFPASVIITDSLIPLALLSNGSPLAAAKLSVNSCSVTLFEGCLIKRSPSVQCLSALSFYWRTQHHLLGALSNFLDLDQHLLIFLLNVLIRKQAKSLSCCCSSHKTNVIVGAVLLAFERSSTPLK